VGPDNLRRLGSQWPGLLVVAAFLVGIGFAGFGAGVVTAMLAVLVAGPAFLLQRRRRRQRGFAPSGRGLDRDANEAMAALALAELRLMNRHRSARLGAFAVTGGILGAMWLVAGRSWVLAVLVLWGLVTAFSAASHFRRRRARH
jgi:1,4-dihydroxy-2-naphthoate octaprenyltransferase